MCFNELAAAQPMISPINRAISSKNSFLTDCSGPPSLERRDNIESNTPSIFKGCGQSLRLTSTKILCFATLCFWQGCAQRLVVIQSQLPAVATRLNPEEGVTEKLGDTPIRLVNSDGTYVLRIDRKDGETEFLVVSSVEEFNGRVLLNTKLNAKQSPDAYQKQRGKYVDLIMKVHRMVLRGQLEEAKDMIQTLEADAGQNIATLLLRFNIALLSGDRVGASQLYVLAKSLYPESKEWGDEAAKPLKKK